MISDHCARRGPGHRRRCGLARLVARQPAARRRRAPHSPAQSITALYAALWAALPGAAVPRRLVAGADRAWSTRRCWRRPEGRALPAFDMQRESILSEAREIASGERDAGFNPESLDAGAALRRSREPFRDASAAASRSCLRWSAAVFALRRIAVDFRARTGVERWLMALLLAASLIAILTTLGILLSLMFESLRFFKLVAADRIPVRHQLEPADGAARRPGRIVGRVRLDPAVLGHGLHRRDHRHDRRHPAGADERDLPDPICPPAAARRG